MTTSRRTREFGVRTALGATRADVIRLVLRDHGLSLAAQAAVASLHGGLSASSNPTSTG